VLSLGGVFFFSDAHLAVLLKCITGCSIIRRIWAWKFFGKDAEGSLLCNAAAALFDLLLDAPGIQTHRRQGNRDRGVRHHGSFCKLSS